MRDLSKYIDNPQDEQQLVLEGAESLQEAMESYYEVTGHIEELDRLIGLSKGLERIYEVALESKEPSEKDEVYLRASLNLALEHYGFDPEHAFNDILQPSTEGLKDVFEGFRTVNKLGDTAGKFKDFVDKVWQAIKRTIDRIWQAAKDFFKKIRDSAPFLSAQNEKMRVKMRNRADAEILQRKSLIKNGYIHLSVDNRQAKNADEILQWMGELSEAVTVIERSYLGRMVDVGRGVVNSIRGFDPQRPEASLKKVNDSFEQIDFEGLADQLKTDEDKTNRFSRWPKNYVMMGPGLLGNKAFFYLKPSVEVKEDSALVRAEKMRSTALRFEEREEAEKEKRQDPRAFDTIKPAEALEIAQMNDTLIEKVAALGQLDRDLDKLKKQLEREGDKLANIYAKAEDMSDSARPYFNAVTQFAAVFAQWSVQPRINLTKQTVSSVRASIAACNVSFTNYTPVD